MTLARVTLLLWPLAVVWTIIKVGYLLLPSAYDPLPVDCRNPNYVILSRPHNLLTLSVLEQLHDRANIFLVVVPSDLEEARETIGRLSGAHLGEHRIHIVSYDPFAGAKQDVHASALASVKEIQARLQHCDDAKMDGVLFNAYGVIGNGQARPVTGLIELAEYKLIGNLQYWRVLEEELLFSHETRVVVSGSESARGLPDMGFPVPTLGDSEEAIEALLNGTGYPSPYRFEVAYAHINALMVLYVQNLPASPYVTVVSPGMTTASFDLRAFVPKPPLSRSLFMYFCRYILMSPVLEPKDIAKSAYDGADLFVRALEGQWPYASGTFVGAMRGTGGQVCNQALVPGGDFIENTYLQEMVFSVVNRYLVIQELPGADAAVNSQEELSQEMQDHDEPHEQILDHT